MAPEKTARSPLSRFSLLVYVIPALIIKIFALFPAAVEQYYSNGIYPVIASVQRMFFGWIPFSIGDLLYAIAVFWLIWQVIKMARRIRDKTANRHYWRLVLTRSVKGVLIVYISFNFLWGLNYNRITIGQQFHLETSTYTKQDLLDISQELVAKLNVLQPAAQVNRPSFKKKKILFKEAILAYENLSQKQQNGTNSAYSTTPEGNVLMANPVLNYPFPSVKPSVYSYLGNYLGFTGYYNPFTGEAQVNTTVPVFIQPFTTCHEIGHQLGYAKESEANFAGYLSASSSADSSFLYSVYFDMYIYASRYLYIADTNTLRSLNKQLSPAVKNDIREMRMFFRRYATPIETAIDTLYAQFLRANEQPSGKMSYNEVIALLIAYRKQYGRI